MMRRVTPCRYHDPGIPQHCSRTVSSTSAPRTFVDSWREPVEPFWQRMPRFFAFPASPDPLLRNALAAAILGAGGWLAFRMLPAAPLLAAGVALLAWALGLFVIARYGFIVITRSSAGYLHPARYPPDLADGADRAVKMLLIMLVMAMLIGFVSIALGSEVLVGVLLLACAALLPAATMVLTTSGSLAEALDPGRCLQVVRAIGAPYAVLCLFLLLLLVGSNQAIEWILPALLPGEAELRRAAEVARSPAALALAAAGPLALGTFAIGFVGNWFFLSMCALLGYTMYQFAPALEIAVVGPGDRSLGGRASAASHARRSREALIGQMIADGELHEAIELVRSDLSERPNDLALNGRLLRLLLADGSGPLVEDHTQRYLALLVRSGNLREALALLDETWQRTPTFEPGNPQDVAPLARAAVSAARLSVAARLVRGFDRRHPGHADIPAVYLLGAQILLHCGRDARKSRLMLEHVIKRYPQSPAAADARRFLDHVVLPGATPPRG
jgi:hypothetical protein